MRETSDATSDPRVVVLIGEGGEFRIAASAWSRVLRLALGFGWEPLGTLRGRAWCGHYAPPCGQMIRARDASGLALAIEDLLDDIPDHDPPEDAARPSPLERLGGASKNSVVRLVGFLRHGAISLFGSDCRHAAHVDLR